MAGVSLATASDVMREIVLPLSREQLNNMTPTLQYVERNSERVDGDEIKLQLHTGRNTGVGMRKEGDTIPAAGKQGYKKMSVPMRTLVARGSVTVQAMNAIRGNAALDGPVGMTEMERLTTDIGRDMNRQAWGSSDGKLATCGTTSGANLVVLATTTPASQMMQFFVGMAVDIGTLDDPTAVCGNRFITAIDNTAGAPKITISGAAVTTTSSHFVFRQGNGGSGANQREFTSIPSMVASTGALYGIDPASYPYWASTYSTDASNRTPTDAILRNAINNVDIESGDPIDIIFVRHGVEAAYAGSLTSGKRYNDTVDLRGGYRALTVSAADRDVPLVRDRDVPNNKAYGLNLSHVFRAEWSNGLEYLEDGSVWRVIPDQLGYEFVTFAIQEFYCDKRSCHFVADKLSEA